MKMHEVNTLLEKSGMWIKDNYGHFKMTTENGMTVRLKMQTTSIRLERKVTTSRGNEWFKITSDYYKNLELLDGKLKINRKLVKI